MEATSFADVARGAVPMGLTPNWTALAGSPVPAPAHGGWLGHVVPGAAFIGLGLHWLAAVSVAAAAATPAAPYRTRAWWPALGCTESAFPVEPVAMLAACVIGINGELWVGHGNSFQGLGRRDGSGYFDLGHLAQWQHVTMYAAFAMCAIVSLLTRRFPASIPAGAPHAALAGALSLEAVLFAFHLEGTAFDVRAHTLLVITIVACAAATLAEAAWPAAPVLGLARAHAALLQGVWFCVLARVLFEGRRAWDPRYHGGYMMLPALLAAWAVALGGLCAAACLLAPLACRGGRPKAAPLRTAGDAELVRARWGGEAGSLA